MSVPTLAEIDYALRSLKDTMNLIQHRQALTETDIQDQVLRRDYASAAFTQGMKTGLQAAGTLLRIEMDTLEHRRLAVERYNDTIARTQ
jgi:hypothetical protein